MIRRLLISILLFFALVGSAIAAIQCGPHKRMTEVLASKYSEAPVAMGTVNQDRLMEVYKSKAGSWTILVTSADGNSCIVAAGQDWEDVLWTDPSVKAAWLPSGGGFGIEVNRGDGGSAFDWFFSTETIMAPGPTGGGPITREGWWSTETGL